MNGNQKVLALPVGLFGIGERTQRVLEVVFSLHGKGRYRISADKSPQAAIIDLDAPGAEGIWRDFRISHPGLPTVLISAQSTPRFGAVLLKKPLAPLTLLSTLDELCSSVATTASARTNLPDGNPVATRSKSAPPPLSPRAAIFAMEDGLNAELCSEKIEILEPSQLDALHVGSSRCLLGAYRQAAKLVRHTGKIHRLSVNNIDHPVYLLPDNGGQVVTRMSTTRLHILCTASLADGVESVAALNTLPDDIEPLPHVSHDAFLWEIALCTSRGRLTESTPLHLPLQLKRWPNFTRLRETPHAMAITALWCNRQHSLADTCSMLEIPQRYVFAFFTAAAEAELIEWVESPPTSAGTSSEFPSMLDSTLPTSAPLPAQPGERRGLIGRILSHLLRQ